MKQTDRPPILGDITVFKDMKLQRDADAEYYEGKLEQLKQEWFIDENGNDMRDICTRCKEQVRVEVLKEVEKRGVSDRCGIWLWNADLEALKSGTMPDKEKE